MLLLETPSSKLLGSGTMLEALVNGTVTNVSTQPNLYHLKNRKVSLAIMLYKHNSLLLLCATAYAFDYAIQQLLAGWSFGPLAAAPARCC